MEWAPYTGQYYLPIQKLVAYYGRGLSGTHLPFNFQLIQAPWRAPAMARLIEDYEQTLPPGGWPNWVLSNHDKPRIASRIGVAQARVVALLLLTLRGTPTLYYGDEIGMRDVPIPPERVQDPFEKNVPGHGFGRDPQRTPMQWDAGPNAGFSTGKPWLPVAADYPQVNVAVQREDPHAMLRLHRHLIVFCRAHPALATGRYVPVATAGDLLAYRREDGDERFLAALNLGTEPLRAAFSDTPVRGRLMLSTHLDRAGERIDGNISLRGDEAVLIRLDERSGQL